MLKEHEFQWIERKTNNIKTNPLDGYCCIIDTEDCARLYILQRDLYKGLQDPRRRQSSSIHKL